MEESKPVKFQVIAALLTVQILFGINYVVSKHLVEIFPPLLWASFRVVFSCFILFGIAIYSKRPAPKLNKEFLFQAAFFSLLGVIINQGSFIVGIRHTSATNSAVLSTLIPIFTLLFVTVLGKERLTLKRGIGFIFALAGVLIIRKIEVFSFSDETFLGDSLIILNCLSFGLFLSLSKKFAESYDPIWTTSWLFLFGSIGLTIIAAPDWYAFHWPPLNMNLFLSMAFAILGSTLLAYFLNLWTLGKTHSSSVALFIYLQPVIASVLAWIWLGEIITLRTLFSSGLIFIGMILSIKKSPQGQGNR
jgi:drug/metabolite transporter (DMT)-like permease